MPDTVDLSETYLFAEGADLVRVPSATLWKRLREGVATTPEADRVASGHGWLVGRFPYDSTWSSWEVHPHADEVVHLLSGDVEFVLEDGGVERRVTLGAGATLVVPKGLWHRAIVVRAGAALHITYGEGTAHRPVR